MLSSSRNKLAALVVIALLALVMAILFFWIEGRRAAAVNAGREARELAAATQELINALLDAETGQRGYLLTGEESYAAPYDAGRAESLERLEAIEGMIELPEREARLRQLVTQKLDELAETMTFARAGDREGALRMVRTERGRRAMDEIRVVTDEMLRQAEEHRLAAQHERDAISFWSQLGMIGALVTIAALVLLIWYGIRRDIEINDEQGRVIQGQARELAIKSEGLERIATSLEAQNEALAKANRDLEIASRARQRAMTDLERRNRDLDQFAYVTSHDLKAPLRAISNLATWIDEDLPEGATADTRDNLKLLRQRAARMESLIEGILTYSRAGRSGVQSVNRPLPPMETMASVFDEVRSFVGIERDLWVVEGGSDVKTPPQALELFQTLGNLASNARKHAGPDKPVYVAAREVDENMLEISVRDEGPGIDPRYHERVFEIFQTLQPRDKVEGAGIGLAIVKKLVHGVGGRVWIESREGHGATFRFTWPKTQSEL